MSPMNSKRILLISSSAPYYSAKAREILDVALAASVFDQDVSILLLGDAVFQLLATQQADQLQQKSISKTLSMLEIYGIDQLYAQTSAMNERQVAPNPITTGLSNLEIRELISRQDVVITL